jgi:hypothetical protein
LALAATVGSYLAMHAASCRAGVISDMARVSLLGIAVKAALPLRQAANGSGTFLRTPKRVTGIDILVQTAE